MSLKNKIIVGLADEAVGSRVADAVAAVETLSGAVTGSATQIGFLGAAATAAQGVTLDNVTSVAQALINLGLAVQNS
jgi:hypothetical protein